MKSTINYYYNLFPENVVHQKDFFYFWIKDEKFYFAPLHNNKEQVLKIYKKLLEAKIKANNIVLNRDNNLVTLYKNREYALIRVNCLENEEVELENFFNLVSNENPIEWGKIWSNKIDYYGYQVNQRALGKESILNSFSYYIGLAENAVEYYNMIEKKEVLVGVQHRRLYAKNYEINYYNPLNMVFDFNVRDLSEYIKFSFFYGEIKTDRLINYINKLNLNSTMMNLLFSRLLFPTYYFDAYDKVLNEENGDEEIIRIFKRAISYEKFIKDFYWFFVHTHNLLKIDWLVK